MRFALILLFLSLVLALPAQKAAQEAFSAGIAALKAKEYAKAEKLFTTAIEEGEVESGIKMSYIYKGFALRDQGKYDPAIACFSKAIAIDPQDPASYTDRALVYSYKGDNASAAKDFEHVLTLDTKGEQAQAAYYYLGRIKMLSGDDKAAIPYFDKYIALNARDAEVYFLRGTAKGNLFEMEAAILDYDKAIELRPDYMEAYANRGVQKLNLVPVKEKSGKNRDCVEAPCEDLLKAWKMGDTAIKDLVETYCEKCR